MTENQTTLALSAAMLRVLHNVFYHPPTQAYLDELLASDLLQAWPALVSDPSRDMTEIADSIRQDGVDAITPDFNRLFAGPGNRHAYPWGSVYTDRDNLLFGESCLAWSQFMTANDFQLDLRSNEPVDHIGLILAVLAEAMDRAVLDERELATVKALLSRHLMPWSTRVLDLVEQHGKTGYYRGFARQARQVLDYWAQALELTVARVPLYR